MDDQLGHRVHTGETGHGDNTDEDECKLAYDHGSSNLEIDIEGTEYITFNSNGLIPSNNATIHAIAQTGAPTSTTEGALWLDTDAGANGTLMCYANGAWRIVQAF